MVKKALNSLSIFFPAYNEAANITSTIEDALLYAPKVANKFEIIVVNDGSTDDTASIVERISIADKRVRLVSHKINRGYGAAVKTGIKSSKLDWVFFTDADRQFRFSELPNFVSHLSKADFIVGRRLKRRDPVIRVIIAQILLKYWNLLLFGLNMKDVDCAYKLIKAKDLKPIKLITESAITITELMVKLKRAGLKFFETPVTHYKREHGVQTGSHPRVIFKAFRESFILWKELKK